MLRLARKDKSRGSMHAGRRWCDELGMNFFTLRAVPPTQFILNRVPFCDGFTPRLADRRGLAPSALEFISDPETISEAVWIADAVLAFEAAIRVN